MSVRKFRDVSEMEREVWYRRDDPRLIAAIRAVWDFAGRTVQPAFPPGVCSFVTWPSAEAATEGAGSDGWPQTPRYGTSRGPSKPGVSSARANRSVRWHSRAARWAKGAGHAIALLHHTSAATLQEQNG